MTSTNRGSLPTSAASFVASVEGVDGCQIDRASLGFGYDLLRHDNNVTCAQFSWPKPGDDQRGEVVALAHHRDVGQRCQFEGGAHGLRVQSKLVEVPAQPGQHLLAIEPQEALLIRAGRVKHQVTEAHFHVRA